MDDFVAALLCLGFLVLPTIVLIAIISSKIKASRLVQGICAHPKSRSSDADKGRTKTESFPPQLRFQTKPQK